MKIAEEEEAARPNPIDYEIDSQSAFGSDKVREIERETEQLGQTMPKLDKQLIESLKLAAELDFNSKN